MAMSNQKLILSRIAAQILRTGTMTKQDLINILGTPLKGGQSSALKQKYFTPDLLSHLKITESDYDSMRTFNRIQTIKLIQRFDLNYILPELTELLPTVIPPSTL